MMQRRHALFDITVEDLLAVYDQLKDRHSLILTNTAALDDGFTIDCPIIIGEAHGLIIQLYECDGLFVMDLMDAAKTKGTHWHPLDVEEAVECIIEFMDGKMTDYPLSPFLAD